jgi:hypothetical protein
MICTHDMYQLLGACYVHGFMYGEGMEVFQEDSREIWRLSPSVIYIPA